MLRRSLLSLIVPAAILLGAVPASAENRLALVIGQSAYKSVPALPNPANDARAVSQMLTDAGFAVTAASDLSQDEMRARLSDFAGQVAAKGADTVALVFYAGHGLQIDGENYLVPVDVDPKREEAEDGSGANSPYTTALLASAKEPGIPIEDTFKRVRLAVNKATDGRQTPWDSSSLTDDFRFMAGAAASPAPTPPPAAAKRTVDEWKRELQGKPIEAANELTVIDGSDESYEAFAAIFAGTPRGLQARDWLDRHRRMMAWSNAVLANTAAAYRGFLAQYPDTDLTATARKMIERLRYRPDPAPAVALSVPATNVGLAAPTCPCNAAPPQQPLQQRANVPAKKRADPDPPRRAGKRPPRVVVEDDVVVARRPPPAVVYEPAGPPIGIGIGIGIGGGGGYRGNYGGGYRRGGY